MANEFQESIYNAIDTLIERRIDALDKDVTVTAVVDSCSNMLENKYVVKYQGGTFTCYAQDGTAYTKGQSVYVLVPEGDFSNTKIILGKSTGTSTSTSLTYMSSLVNDYNLVGTNVLTRNGSSTMKYGLYSYKISCFETLYEMYGEDNDCDVDQTSLAHYVDGASAIMVRAKFNTANLSSEHRSSKTGDFGLIVEVMLKDQSTTDGYTLGTYVLDSASMSGNPFSYMSDVTQYAIFPVDPETFAGVYGVYAYSEGFVDADDNARISLGPDIFVKDVEIYALSVIDAVSGDYKLKLSTPHGTVFKEADSDLTVLDATGRLLYKDNTDMTDSATFYWFKEDGRVTATSSSYSVYGGAGWSYLSDSGHSQTFSTPKLSNRCYENRYMCVCVYQQEVVLRTKFSLYNESERREITITASPTADFSFDSGDLTLTCSVDGQTDFESDVLYSFCWSKTDEDGTVTSYTQTYEELMEVYESYLKNQDSSASEAVNAKRKAVELLADGITWEKNVYMCYVTNIDNSATFTCSVYKKDKSTDADSKAYLVGSADIRVTNVTEATPTDHYIVIENGDQVFQYSESGVSPCDERYTDPLPVYDLVCHFYDKAGYEVDQSLYSIKWEYPSESSMIKLPSTGVDYDPVSGDYDIYTGTVDAPISIADVYDYQALDNQVTAIVAYKGVQYTKDTTFLFAKVGDNGTNGTDIVAKVTLGSYTGDDYPFISVSSSGTATWSDGATLNSRALTLSLYQRNVKLTSGYTTSWTMSGGNAYCKRMGVDSSSGKVSYMSTSASKPYSNQIVRGAATYDENKYYAFFPVPTVLYVKDTYKVVIDKERTLKEVVYNADGRNPQYNKKQGLCFNVYDKSTGKELTDLWVLYYPTGGLSDDTLPANAAKNTSDFSFVTSEDSTKASYNAYRYYDASIGAYMGYVVPNDTYTGEFCNNNMYAVVKDSNRNTIADIVVPIHMSLNTYGLASLNAWDGNSVEIDEDNGFILAPQIGAGTKNSANQFTGIVMGTSKTYDQTTADIGLLGFKDGEQSIFLDAETGSATFGLQPTVNSDSSGNYRYTEGRIELVPGGTSKIGNWKIGSDFLYNVIGAEIGTPYSSDYKRSIPHANSGIMLSADPAYVSIKGRTLTQAELQTSITAGTNIVTPGDTFELELNPQKSSLFTIYRHTTKDDSGNETGTWRRTEMVGIDDAGRFYTNSMKDEGSALTLNYLPAFGKSSADHAYRGVDIEIGSSSSSTVPLLKFFASQSEINAGNKSTTTVYLSGGDKSNEYKRPMVLIGKTVSLYASSSTSTSTSSDHKLLIENDTITLGHSTSGKNSLLTLTNSGTGSLTTAGTFSHNIGGAYTGTFSSTVGVTATGAVTGTLKSNLTLSVAGNESHTVSGNESHTVTGTIGLTAGSGKTVTVTNSTASMSLTSSVAKLGGSSNYLSLPQTTGTAELLTAYDMKIRCKTSALDVVNDGGSTGIRLQAKATSSNSSNYDSSMPAGSATILLTPSSAQNSYVKLQGDHGETVTVGGSTTYTESTDSTSTAVYPVVVTPGIQTNWGVFNSTIGGSNISLHVYRDIKSEVGWVYADKFVGSAVSLTGDGLMNTISVGTSSDYKNMNKGWFDEIQRLYNNWGGGSFPANLSGYVTTSSLSTTLSSYAKKGTVTVTGLSTSCAADVESCASQINRCSTAINTLSKQINTLLGA